MHLPWIEIVILFSLVPISIGLFNFKKFNKPIKIIYIFLVISTLVDSTSYALATYYNKNNLWLFNLLIIFQFLFLSWFFYSVFNKKIFKRIIVWYYITGQIIILLNLLFYQGLYVFNNYSLLIMSLGVITFSIFKMIETSNTLTSTLITNTPLFYIKIGLLIYFTGTLTIMIIKTKIINFPLDQFLQIWAINNILTILFHITLSIAFLLCRKTTTS